MLCLNVHLSLKCSISLLSWYHMLLLPFSSNCYPSSFVAHLKKKKKKKKRNIGLAKRFIELFPLPTFWPTQCTRTQFLLICWTKIVIKERKKVKSLSRVQLFVTPWTVAYQTPLPSMEFSRQEYWSGLPIPSLGDLPDPQIKPGSPALQADALPSETPGKLETISYSYS